MIASGSMADKAKPDKKDSGKAGSDKKDSIEIDYGACVKDQWGRTCVVGADGKLQEVVVHSPYNGPNARCDPSKGPMCSGCRARAASGWK